MSFLNFGGKKEQDYVPEVFNNDSLPDHDSVPSQEMVYEIHTDSPSPKSRMTLVPAVRWLVYAVAFLIPLWFLPITGDVLEFNKQVLLVVLTGAGLVLYLLDIIKSGVWRHRSNNLAWALFGLVGASAISVIFSVSRHVSVFGSMNERSFSLITLVSLAVLFILSLNVIEDRGKTLKKILSLSLALVFVLTLLQALGISTSSSGMFAQRGFNTVGSFNGVGILAAVALGIFGAGSASRSSASGVEDRGRSKLDLVVSVARYVGLVTALFLVILINWWVVWTVAFVSLLVLVAFQSAGQAASLRKIKMGLFAPPLAIIVLGIFLMLVNFNWSSIKSKLPAEIAPSQKISWSIAADSLKSRPLGSGAENFGIAYDKFKPLNIANSIFYQVRFADSASEVSNMAVEGGAIMLLALAVLIWLSGRELFLKIKNGLLNDEAGMVWAPVLSLIVALFLYPFNMTFVTLLVFFLALAAMKNSQEKVVNLESDAKSSFLGSLVFIVGLVLVLVVGYFTVNNYQASVLFAKAQAAGDKNKSIEYYVGSVNANSYDSRALRLLSQTVLAQLADELKAGPKKDEAREAYNSRLQNLMTFAVNISIRATTVDPADSQNWVNRGLVYQNLLGLVGGADQAALNVYNESLARNPNDPQTYLRIGNLYLYIAEAAQRTIVNPPKNQQVDFAALRKQAEENLDKAGENFQKAVSLYNNYGQALYNSAVVYER
ncbi:MAG: hypothetical protein HY506_00940, partial [Candidatus Yanofskybacteria bacterium]|nr:hypothetical protein [Candidatus Yanofskybacteria bacterium]